MRAFESCTVADTAAPEEPPCPVPVPDPLSAGVEGRTSMWTCAGWGGCSAIQGAAQTTRTSTPASATVTDVVANPACPRTPLDLVMVASPGDGPAPPRGSGARRR